MYCAGISNCFEDVQSMIIGLGWRFNFYLSEIHFLRTVVHILFAMQGVLPKDLELMLVEEIRFSPQEKIVNFLPHA